MFVVAIGGEACDCTGRATIPGAADCLTAADCAPNETCRDGRCVAGLPLGEGEGEGEGEPAEGEGEGEGEEEPVDLIVAPTSLTLPQTDVGVPVTGTAQLVNVGGGPVTLGALTSSDPRFVVAAPAAGLVIARNASETLTVRFTATEAGAASTTITVAVAQPSGSSSPVLSVSGSAPSPPVDGSLVVRAGPDDSSIGREGCLCRAGKDFGDGNGFTILPAALLRLRYEVVGTGETCARPSNAACGFDDTCSTCPLGAKGAARWRAARFVRDVREGEDWIIDEAITHGGDGADGDFVVKATLVDDCLALQGSVDSTINEFCCLGTCERNDFSCYDLAFTGCANDCRLAVGRVANDADCLERGPIAVRASMSIDGVERQFCGTMTRSQPPAPFELARVQRRAGVFSIVSVAASFREIGVGDPCD